MLNYDHEADEYRVQCDTCRREAPGSEYAHNAFRLAELDGLHPVGRAEHECESCAAKVIVGLDAKRYAGQAGRKL